LLLSPPLLILLWIQTDPLHSRRPALTQRTETAKPFQYELYSTSPPQVNIAREPEKHPYRQREEKEKGTYETDQGSSPTLTPQSNSIFGLGATTARTFGEKPEGPMDKARSFLE